MKIKFVLKLIKVKCKIIISKLFLFKVLFVLCELILDNIYLEKRYLKFNWEILNVGLLVYLYKN